MNMPLSKPASAFAAFLAVAAAGEAATGYFLWHAKPASTADIVDSVKDGVVRIESTVDIPDEDGSKKEGHAAGSGFIIDGNIITNYHVVAEAKGTKVEFSNGHKCDAVNIGDDTWTDKAVLKLADSCHEPLHSLTFADSDKVRIGDSVISIGNPFNIGESTGTGIVSATGRDVDDPSVAPYIQISSPINHGNSGGPTFNDKGQIICMNTAIYSPSGGSVGVGFCEPANDIAKELPMLKAKGTYPWGYLGAQVSTFSMDSIKETEKKLDEIKDQIKKFEATDKTKPEEKKSGLESDLTDLMQGKTGKSPDEVLAQMKDSQAAIQTAVDAYHKALADWKKANLSGEPNAVYVADVNADGPAKGLGKGDIVLSVASKPEPTAKDLAEDVMKLGAGKEVHFRILHDGVVKEVAITLGVRPRKDKLEEVIKPKTPDENTPKGEKSPHPTPH